MPRALAIAHDGEHLAELSRLVDVNQRDGDFLEKESSDLDLLKDAVRMCPVPRSSPEPQHDGGRLEYYGVRDDHVQYQSQLERIPHNEVQPRPQHHGLPVHHEHPSYHRECHVDEVIRETLGARGYEQGSDRVDHDAVGRGDEGPEVDARVPLEYGPYDEAEFDDIVESDGIEDDDGGDDLWALGAAGLYFCHSQQLQARAARARGTEERPSSERESSNDLMAEGLKSGMVLGEKHNVPER